MADLPKMLVQFGPMLILFVMFYFLLIRPQQQKQKKHQAMVDGLKKGDKIITIGGLYGTVTGFKGDQTIILKVANGVEVEFLRNAISTVREEGKESREAKKEAEEAKEE